MNKLSELKAFLDMLAKTKRRGHLDVDFDGERFHWTYSVKNMTAAQLEAFVDRSPGTRLPEPERKEHHGT